MCPLFPPQTFVLPLYAKFEATQMASTITPPRQIRRARYDLRVLPFMNKEADGDNDQIGSSEDEQSKEYNLGTRVVH